MGYITFSYIEKPKTAYIFIPEVFEKFELKKDLEHKFLNTKNVRQKVLDSLAMQLRLLATKLDQEKIITKENETLYNNAREDFYKKRQTFEEDNKQLSREYDNEILTQLNQYVKDYGQENNYKYIYGNDNNGSLMYAEENLNISKEIIKYINKKYKGVK